MLVVYKADRSRYEQINNTLGMGVVYEVKKKALLATTSVRL